MARRDYTVELYADLLDALCERGIAATYYLRTKAATPERLRLLESMNHEVGYHYEDVVKTGGDREAAYERFGTTLAEFRRYATIDTVAAHGNLSRHRNVRLWDGERDLASFGLLDEAFLSLDLGGAVAYRSDTDRNWDRDPTGPGTTPELIEEIRAGDHDRLCLLSHPSRWTDGYLEYAYQLGWDAGAIAAKRAFRSTTKAGTTATTKLRAAASLD